MDDFAYVIPQLALALPSLATLIVGLVLLNVRRDRLTARARSLGVAGCVVLVLAGLVNAGWALSLPMMVRDASAQQIGLVGLGFGVVLVILDSVGLGLLIAAVLAGGRRAMAPPSPPGHPQPAWPQSAGNGGLLPPLEG